MSLFEYGPSSFSCVRLVSRSASFWRCRDASEVVLTDLKCFQSILLLFKLRCAVLLGLGCLAEMWLTPSTVQLDNTTWHGALTIAKLVVVVFSRLQEDRAQQSWVDRQVLIEVNCVERAQVMIPIAWRQHLSFMILQACIICEFCFCYPSFHAAMQLTWLAF